VVSLDPREVFGNPPPWRSSHWFACEEPERPTDVWVRWHYVDCAACRIKADALQRLHPDDSNVAWLVDILAPPTAGAT